MEIRLRRKPRAEEVDAGVLFARAVRLRELLRQAGIEPPRGSWSLRRVRKARRALERTPDAHGERARLVEEARMLCNEILDL